MSSSVMAFGEPSEDSRFKDSYTSSIELTGACNCLFAFSLGGSRRVGGYPRIQGPSFYPGTTLFYTPVSQ